MRKKITSLFLSVLMILSVVAMTSVSSFAADSSTANTPVTVRFIDGDTAQPVPVTFSYAQKKGVIIYDTAVTVKDTSTYTWTPTKQTTQRFKISQIPEGYTELDAYYYFDYKAGYPKPYDNRPTMRIINNRIIEVKIYKENSPSLASIEVSGLYTGENKQVLPMLSGGGLSGYIVPDGILHFYPATNTLYELQLYYTNEEGDGLEQVEPTPKFLYNGTQFLQIANNNYPFFESSGKNLKIQYEEPAYKPLTVKFIDADTKQPVQVNWSIISTADSHIETEYSAQKTFVPNYYIEHEEETSYGVRLNDIPPEYLWPLSEIAMLYYGKDGIAPPSRLVEVVNQKSNATADPENNTLTVELKKFSSVTAEPVTIYFADRNTGTTIAPDTVTMKPNSAAETEIFENQPQIKFVPSFYMTNRKSETYDISIKADGYEELLLPKAFTYYSKITSALNNDNINVNGNIITIYLDKKASEPDPTMNLLKNADFEGTGIPNWFLRGSDTTTIMQTNSQYRGGAYSLYMAYFKNEALNNHIDQTCFVAEPGNYQFSAYIKTAAMLNGAGAMLMMEARDANGLLLASSSSPALSNTNDAWQQLTTQMYAPPGTASIVVKIGGIYCTGGFFVDDAELRLIK